MKVIGEVGAVQSSKRQRLPNLFPSCR